MTVDKQTEEKLIALLKQKINRQLLYYLDICARCAICRDACHQYVATKDVHYLPAYRAELIRRIYKKYFTRTGRIIPSLYEGKEITDDLLDELYKVTYACTGCRRCMFYCPFSIDTTWVLSVAKTILIAAGKGSPILTELADAAIEKGKNIDLFKGIMLDILKDTERKLQEKVGDPKATIPVEKEDSNLLYVALSGEHTILPAAIIFHQAKENWTLSLFEASNYGYFLGDTAKAKTIAQRIVDEAKRLKVKEVVVTECGHAHRVFKFFYESWAKEKYPFQVSSILEIIHRYLKEGRINLNSKYIKEPVTYHDPCQIGRNYGVFAEPRDIISQVSADFREMNPQREKNWCCGAGGGIVAQPDLDEFRIKTGELKVKQIRQTGAKIVVSPCENCRLQIETLNEKYNLGIRISSIMDLVAYSLLIPREQS
ncbi:MAG TPA: hypothetical protein DHV62_00040 [Elusimicrobia bacterium]|nr:hypothetical protein [Elusimicrobiota bacterium]